MRSSKPITITLGRYQQRVEDRVASGEFESASEVLRAAMRALEREDAALNEALRHRVVESLADERPSRVAEDVYESLRAKLRRPHHDG